MKINQAFTILQRAGGIRAARIITDNNKKLSRLQVFFMARRLRRGVPVAKIIHQKWFYGLSFYTNRFTLDPRPDTETLVAAVISDMSGTAPRILDLGTGTGCVLVSLIKNIAGASGVGIELSRRAACVARRNVAMHTPERAIVFRRSYHKTFMPYVPFDVIVSNPPYIARGDVRVDSGARHDPELALYADNDGYAEYEIIAHNALMWLRPGGRIYLEIGEGMESRVRDIFEKSGWTFNRAEKDLASIVRVLVFEK